MAVKRYAVRTVVAAQRRVLRLAAGVIRGMSARERARLRVSGTGGLATLDEVFEHCVQAANLKIRRAQPTTAKRPKAR